MHANPGKAVAGGFVATLVMTALMYTAPRMGLPEMDIAGMLASFLGVSWMSGMTIHFVNGSVIFALFYAYVVYRSVPGAPTMRGVFWGLMLWFIAQIAVMPMMGAGVFSSNTPFPRMMVFASLLGHLVYGGLLGKIAGIQAESPALGRPSHQGV